MSPYSDPDKQRAYDSAKHKRYTERYNTDPEYRARRRANQDRYYASVKQIVQDAKKPCVVCGESDPACIDFHHRDPSQKEFGIAYARQVRKQQLIEEIDKCVTLCANCHRKHHAGTLGVDVSTL